MSIFSNATLLITGGTGSFGHVVLSKVLKTDIREIRIFSRDEKKQDDMRRELNDDRLKFYIGNVRDLRSVNAVMPGVDYVFHAAALKQVPSCEFFPLEAVKTNILGTENVIDSAVAHHVKKVICLSTDKAVYPINAMGLSKAMMEKVMIAKSRDVTCNGTVICGTRYGNVAASRGSVIPHFVSQVMHDQPITVTNPEMTRFLMSLDQAVDLVLYAFEHGKSGDIFVQKSPATTLKDLAEAILDLFHSDVPIHNLGTRHGEKLHETLISTEESLRTEDLGKYYRIAADARDLNYDKYVSGGHGAATKAWAYTSQNTERLNVEEIKKYIHPIIFDGDKVKKEILE